MKELLYLFLDVLEDSYVTLISMFRRQEPSLLALSMHQFTESTWVEDLLHYKHVDHYLYKGKLNINNYPQNVQ